MTPKARKLLLLDLDLPVTDLAQAAGVSRPACASAVSGKRQTPVLRRRILAALRARRPSLTYASLWDGSPDPGVDHLPRGRKRSVTPVHISSPTPPAKGQGQP